MLADLQIKNALQSMKQEQDVAFAAELHEQRSSWRGGGRGAARGEKAQWPRGLVMELVAGVKKEEGINNGVAGRVARRQRFHAVGD